MISTTQSLTHIQSLSGAKPAEKVGEVAREFESLLLSELLRSGSKPMFGETLLDGGSAGRMAREQFFSQLASHAAEAGGLGLARQLESQANAQEAAAHSDDGAKSS